MKKLFSLLLISGLMLGCTGVPDDKEVQSLVSESILSDGLTDLFSIKNFKKTNGFKERENIYVVDVEYDLVFKKSFGDVVKEVSHDPTGPQYGVFGAKIILMAVQKNFGNFKVGDVVHRVEKYTLNNTEKGWLVAEQN